MQQHNCKTCALYERWKAAENSKYLEQHLPEECKTCVPVEGMDNWRDKENSDNA